MFVQPVRKMRKSPSGFSAKQSPAFAFLLKPFAFTWLHLLTGQVLIVSSFYICASGTPLFLCYIIDSVPKNIPFRGNHRLYIHFASLNICITVDTRNASDPVDYRRPGQRKTHPSFPIPARIGEADAIRYVNSYLLVLK